MRVFVIRRDDQITLILGSKHYVRKGEAGQTLYELAQQYRASRSEDDLQQLQDFVNPYSKYVRDGHLSEVDGNLCLGGSKVPLPASLAKTIMEYLNNGYDIKPLVNFWNWCLLNPNTTARDRFFEYCEAYGVTITDSGLAILYKAVTHKTKSDADLAHFVATEYLHIKRESSNTAGMPGPAAYYVMQNRGSFTSVFAEAADAEADPKCVGNLRDLFLRIDELSLESETVYTDKHTRQMDIKLGVPVFKDREQCDPNIHNECSYGLHVGSFKYVSMFGHGDDTVFATLVNPMNVVALPNYDNSKIRVCEYLPYAIMNRKGSDWEELESQYFEEEYVPYVAMTLKDMAAKFATIDVDSLEGDAFELAREQANVVRTKIADLYENNEDVEGKIAGAEAPIEAPYEETFFDVDDPQARNQLYQDTEPSLFGNNSVVDETSLNAWREAVSAGQTILSFGDWMEDDDDDEGECCWDCGEYDYNCTCGDDDMPEASDFDHDFGGPDFYYMGHCIKGRYLGAPERHKDGRDIKSVSDAYLYWKSGVDLGYITMDFPMWCENQVDNDRLLITRA